MSLLDDLKNCDIKSIIIVIICILLFHQYWCKTKEPMADISDAELNQKIRQAVRQVYLADVQAIRNLSETANKLQKEGLTIAGNLRVSGKVIADGEIKAGGEISNTSYSLSGLNTSIDTVNKSLSKSITDSSEALEKKISDKISKGSNISLENVSNPGYLLSMSSNDLSKAVNTTVDFLPGKGHFQPVTFYRKWKINNA